MFAFRRTKNMIYGAILAGGVGSRIKSIDIPKQFVELDGKPVIIYTLESMLKVDRFDYIYIAAHGNYIEHTHSIVEKFIPTEQAKKVRITSGGKERLDSIRNVTDCITADHGINEDDIIVIHDAARPFVTEQILNDSIDMSAKYGATVCGLPASDTILCSDDGVKVSSIPKRSTIFQGQAPDSFLLKRFLDMQDALTDEQKAVITGTSQICTMNNHDIYLIPGDGINFKITTDSDLVIAENIVKNLK